jgi:hypothetical protein
MGACARVMVKALCYKPESSRPDEMNEFLLLPNPSGRTRLGGLLSLLTDMRIRRRKNVSYCLRCRNFQYKFNQTQSICFHGMTQHNNTFWLFERLEDLREKFTWLGMHVSFKKKWKQHMHTIMYKMSITLVQFGPQLEWGQVLVKVHNMEFHDNSQQQFQSC